MRCLYVEFWLWLIRRFWGGTGWWVKFWDRWWSFSTWCCPQDRLRKICHDHRWWPWPRYSVHKRNDHKQKGSWGVFLKNSRRRRWDMRAQSPWEINVLIILVTLEVQIIKSIWLITSIHVSINQLKSINYKKSIFDFCLEDWEAINTAQWPSD